MLIRCSCLSWAGSELPPPSLSKVTALPVIGAENEVRATSSLVKNNCYRSTPLLEYRRRSKPTEPFGMLMLAVYVLMPLILRRGARPQRIAIALDRQGIVDIQLIG